MPQEMIDIVVDEVLYETDLAILVLCDEEEIWLPKSQLEEWPDIGEEGTVIMTEWIAEEKGLI